MSEVVATAERVVHAPVERVMSALADYEDTRRRILPEQFSDYRVETGGQGAGTTVAWRFAATSKRVRDQVVTVTEPVERSLVETDANSSMMTTWNGAEGVGGFFERTFAPKGLRRVYDQLLDRLDAEVATA